jgi:hypothetical protein
LSLHYYDDIDERDRKDGVTESLRASHFAIIRLRALIKSKRNQRGHGEDRRKEGKKEKKICTLVVAT